MKFELTHYGDSKWWSWEASDKASGTIAVGPEIYESEEEARSAIAKARKAFAGYKFAKVEVIEQQNDPPSPVLTNFSN